MDRVRALACLIALVLLVLVSGCWSRQEIEDLAFVTMAGVDLGQTPGQVRLTLHIAKPSALAGGIGGLAPERQVSVVSSVGATIEAASASLAEALPRRITWAHSMIVAVGEDYARTGLTGLMDFLTRVESVRETVTLVVVKGGTASKLMEAEFALNQLPSTAILGMIKNAALAASTSVTTTVDEVMRILETEGSEVVVAGIELKPTDQQRPSLSGELRRDTILWTAETAGVAIFRADRLVGWFDQEQSQGLQWIRGEVASSVVSVPHPTEPEVVVSLRARSSGSRVSAAFTDGVPEIRVIAEVFGSIGDSEETPDPSDYDVAVGLKRALESAVRAKVVSAIEEGTRNLQSDVFGFGTMLYRSNPLQWEHVKGRWDELLQRMRIEVEVHARMPQTGLLVRDH